MGDGTTRLIADVRVGDMVLTADPQTGERGPRAVTDTIIGDGMKELVDIEINGQVITATDRHPFWVDDEGRWVGVQAVVGRTPGWQVEALGRGSHQGRGWVLREYTPSVNPTGRMLRSHPGGGYHGPDPYWRLTDHNARSGVIR